MSITKITFDNVDALSQRDIAYQTNPALFKDFYNYTPDLAGLQSAIKERSKFPVDRKLLVKELKHINRNINLDPKQVNNINALADEHTYTVITAHQPSLLTGPLYFIIKVLSTINLARKLTKESSKLIVPVFIIGSEDHDFEEVNHLNIFNKKLTWETNQTGPVGRMNLDGLEAVISSFYNILGDGENAEQIKNIIKDASATSNVYNDFVLKLVNNLFGKFGVVVANMDNKGFKSSFAPIMVTELIQQPSAELIQNTQERLQQIGFGGQAHARDINLFHLGDGYRERIVLKDGFYKVLNTDISWTKDEAIAEIKSHPEDFSPNVVMRPIYQESIWPNIAYVGGGGELAYWLERKAQFDHFNIFFPVLIRRNSLMILEDHTKSTWSSLGFEIKDLFKAEHLLINSYLKNTSEVEFDLTNEYQKIEDALNDIYSKAEQADKSLRPFSEAEGTRILKQIDQIEARIKRSIKKQEEQSINKISKTLSKLFPNNGLQERSDNFFQYYLKYGDILLDELLLILDPLEKEFIVYHP